MRKTRSRFPSAPLRADWLTADRIAVTVSTTQPFAPSIVVAGLLKKF